MPTDHQRALLRHIVATLAYRAGKVVRDAHPDFARFKGASTMRMPVEILAHMGDLMDWAIKLVEGEYVWRALGSDDWDQEVDRFFDRLATLDRLLASDVSAAYSPETLIQGPLADALTHVGQLAMLRGAAGFRVRPESYARAEIVAGRVGLDQPMPKVEFDGDASARRS